MNLKRAIGILLLGIMCITAYGLFGVGTISMPVPANETVVNQSVTPEISAYHGVTMEEQASVDFGCILIIILLIGITEIGLHTRPQIYPEKGSKEELDELNETEKK